MHQSTITLPQARQYLAEQQQQKQQQKQARYEAFKAFKSDYHDLLDAADWQYYVEATGLRLATLARFFRRHAPAPARLFARAPGEHYFEPLNARTGEWVDATYRATKASPQLLAYMHLTNPGWAFKAAPDLHQANETD